LPELKNSVVGLELNSVDKAHKIGCHGNMPSRIEKNTFSSFIYRQSSTNPANFVKISLIDVEIIGLTEIAKNVNKIK